ncbi:aminotransferase class I/II-fold pyridoxal phosphate-dependent enzyme, partial [Nonomuraea fuscirosea]|uniref:aminotransferase class I/II-fold pyridoxal phosphate-dependent enzyme n=1 Tax=Nonomuraea fuscirosea TaxID=1291556 RepID=UPI0034490048
PWARLQAALAAPAQSLRETDTQAVIDTSPWPCLETIKKAADSAAGIILDLTYDPFADDPITSRLSEVIMGNTIACLSLSKVFGLAGMRLGILAASPELINEARELADPFALDYAQLATCRVLFSTRGDQFRRDVLHEALSLRARVVDQLRRLLPHARITPPQTNFVSVYVHDLPEGMKEKLVQATACKDYSPIGLLRLTANQDTLSGLEAISQEMAAAESNR